MIAIVYAGPIQNNLSNMISYTINSICEMLNDNVIIVDFFKSSKLQKLCGKHKYVKCDFADCNNYNDVTNASFRTLESNKINKVIWLFGFLDFGFRKERHPSITLLEKRLKNGNINYVKYQQTVAVHKRYLFMKACSEKCDIVVQFLHDIQLFTFDQTIDFRGKFYKTYLARTCGCIYMPTFEIGLALYNTRNIKKEKDFVFWCTAKTEDRKYLSDRKIELESLGYDIKIVCVGDKSGTISEDEYDDKLAASLFTCCVPAYNKNAFSIWRIFEALANDCICLVTAENNLNDLRSTFPDICDVIINRGLILNDFRDLKKKIEELKPMHKEILNELKCTESFKKVTNFEWCKKRWLRMLEVNL